MKSKKMVILIILLVVFLVLIVPQLFDMLKSRGAGSSSQQIRTPVVDASCPSTKEKISLTCAKVTSDEKKCGMTTQTKITDCNGNVTYEEPDLSKCVQETVFDKIPCNKCGTQPIYACPVGNPPPSTVFASQIAKYNNLWMWAGTCSVSDASACE